MKEEKPKSRVIPLSLLCGCLSSAAVESWEERAATAVQVKGFGLLLENDAFVIF